MSQPTSPSGFNTDPQDVYDMRLKIEKMTEERKHLREMLSECVVTLAQFEVQVRHSGLVRIADNMNRERSALVEFMNVTREKYSTN